MIDKIHLDKDSKEPLYKQLKSSVLNMIWNNELSPGDLFPTEDDLMNALKISKSTIRQCMNELANEGYVEKKRNRGTVVLNRKINLGYSDSISDFNERIKSLGLKPKTELINLTVNFVGPEIYSHLNIPTTKKVIELVRLRKINDVPTVLIHSYIPYDANKYILARDFEHESLYSILSDHPESGLSYVRRRVYAVEGIAEYTKIFNVEDSTAFLAVETVAYDGMNRAMEYSLSYSPGDRNEYTFTVRK